MSKHAGKQHLLGDGLGGVLEGGGLLQAQRLGFGVERVTDAGPVAGPRHGPGQIGELGQVEAQRRGLRALPTAACGTPAPTAEPGRSRSWPSRSRDTPAATSRALDHPMAPAMAIDTSDA